MKEKIIEMLKLQEKLNTMTSGENWKDGITNKGKIISWKRCMYMEMVEAIDSTPWKHWKAIDGKTDIANFKIEIVDIWHFLQSEILRLISLEDSTELINKYVNQKAKLKLPIVWDKEKNLKLNDYLKDFENFIKLTFQEDETKENLENLTKQFFICLDAAQMTFNELYNLYIGKNVLNKFRQDNGYKEGTYKKIWSNGKEDNVTMQNFIKENDNFTFDILYKYLEKEYKK